MILTSVHNIRFFIFNDVETGTGAEARLQIWALIYFFSCVRSATTQLSITFHLLKQLLFDDLLILPLSEKQ
jgi:hypothetical protein